MKMWRGCDCAGQLSRVKCLTQGQFYTRLIMHYVIIPLRDTFFILYQVGKPCTFILISRFESFCLILILLKDFWTTTSLAWPCFLKLMQR